MAADPQAAARVTAERALQERGFTRQEGSWTRPFATNDGTLAVATATISSGFPHEPLHIAINQGALQHRAFNCDKNGKLCLAPPTGVLIDAENPTGIVRDSINRAEGIIARIGLPVKPEVLVEEFINYWDAQTTILSHVTATQEPRPVVVVEIEPGNERSPSARTHRQPRPERGSKRRSRSHYKQVWRSLSVVSRYFPRLFP